METKKTENQPLVSPEKTTNILPRHQLFLGEMMSEKRVRKLHTDDASYPDLGSASDWLKQISHTAQPIRGTTQKWLVTCHQYRISALVFQTSFRRETVGDIAKCWLFSRSTLYLWLKKLILFNVNLILTFSMYLQQM